MSAHNSQHNWTSSLQEVYTNILPILTKYGYTLDDNQPHTKGERFLMQAVTTTSGEKIILFGVHTASRTRVVIKVASDSAGRKELRHERTCRTLLHTIDFAYTPFVSPEELDFIETATHTLSIQVYIAQTQNFLERPITEQFTFALQAFTTQEGARATTYGHLKNITNTFGNRESTDYIKLFQTFTKEIIAILPDNHNLQKDLLETEVLLMHHEERIAQYCGFLTHTDFVPHNFRIADDVMYLLDFSSLLFGNKYEGWARFINFMALHHPQLAQYLEQYVVDNRAPEEVMSLHLMRLYRLGEIIRYYAGTLEKSSGDLHALNAARIDFWHQVLIATRNNEPVSEDVRQQYIQLRDQLRSTDEHERQKDLL